MGQRACKVGFPHSESKAYSVSFGHFDQRKEENFYLFFNLSENRSYVTIILKIKRYVRYLQGLQPFSCLKSNFEKQKKCGKKVN